MNEKKNILLIHGNKKVQKSYKRMQKTVSVHTHHKHTHTQQRATFMNHYYIFTFIIALFKNKQKVSEVLICEEQVNHLSES